MVTYDIAQLNPGMIIAEDVYTPSGQLIISKGSILTNQMIQHLKFYSVINVQILPNEVGPKVEIKPESETTYYKKIRKSKEFKEFQAHFTECVTLFRNQLEDFTQGNVSLDTDALLQDTVSLFNHNLATFSILDMLHNMRNLDDSTYVHCINVAVLSRLLGTWAGVSGKDLDVLTLCGLLHDVGKISIPDKILNKPGKLTPSEFERIKNHSVSGYRLLQEEDMDVRIKNAALMHHERADGSGYPLGLKGNQIDPFASIVAIADVYDALTSDRCYRAGVCPFEVIAMFEEQGLQLYNPQYILVFLEHIAQSYVNSSAKLTDGSVGKIIMINKQITRPLIRLNQGDFINLEERLDLYVEEIV